MVRKIGWLFVFGLSGILAIAQKNIYRDNLVWTQYILKARIAEKWSIHFDAGYRTNEYVKHAAQYFVRPGITYQLSPKVSLVAGYAYFETSQFLNGYQDIMRPEHRLFQRLTVLQPTGRFEIRHRYRLEQRFNHNYKSGHLEDGYTSYYRATYQLYASFPINHAKMVDRTLFAFASNEVFIHFGKQVYNYFDQYRAIGGMGFQLNKNVTLSAFYQYIFGQQMTGNRLYSYNSFGFTIMQSIDFRKKAQSELRQ